MLLDAIPAVHPSGILPEGQKELAFLHGAVEAEPGFPAPVLQALRSQPDDGYDGPPLLVTDATLTSAQYETDRGPRVLPTWVVQAQGARCGPPAPSVRSGAATARPDDHLSRDVS